MVAPPTVTCRILPPTCGARSSTVTSKPWCARSAADTSPPTPAPTTATRPECTDIAPRLGAPPASVEAAAPVGVDAARARSFSADVRTSVLGVAILAQLAAGCFTVSGASSNARPAVLLQASTDLDCPQRDIRVTKEWGGRFETVGCGHKAVYNTGCDGLHCTAAPEGQVVPWLDRPPPTPTPDDYVHGGGTP